jgi:hypothetical protein
MLGHAEAYLAGRIFAMYTSSSGDVDLRRSRATGWVGWIAFAAAMMVISGVFSIIWGIVALARHHVFLVGRDGNVINLNYTAWGWISLILGVVVLLTGLFVLGGSMLALIMTVLIASLSMVQNLFVIGAYPIWSSIVIAVDVLVIYAVTVHGGELRDNTV